MRLYSTLSGVEEDFAPSGQSVKMYVCGITPYSSSHVGHAFSSVVFDVLRRYLEFQGHKVRHVQNFTDIDDKIIARSTEEGVSYRELSDKYIEEYAGDMERLRVMPAHVYPLATEAIPRMQEIIRRLVEKGHAYESGGDVYFRVSGCEGYGKLSHRSIESMIAGARVVALQGKEHPMDFTLWKAAKPGRAGLGESVGAGPAGLAHRVQRHRPGAPGGNPGYPRRRPGPGISPSRERDCPERMLYRRVALLPILGP